MNQSDWENYLKDQGAEFGETLPIEQFSATTSQINEESAHITPLLHQGLLEIAGQDSAKFMQGQMTCDVDTVTTHNSLLGATCTPKGRMYSSFRLWQKLDDEAASYLLRMRQTILESTLTTLGKYIVFFKSQMHDISADWVGIGIMGDACDEPLKQFFAGLPQQPNEVVQGDQGMLIKVPGTRSRYEAWVPIAQGPVLWEQLHQHATATGTANWLLDDIANGIVEVNDATREMFIPQAVNYQAVGAVSFTKGCYTGQEIVARTQYRGKSKRFMVRVMLDNAPTMPPGVELTDADSGNVVATLVEAAPLNNTQQQALLVIRSELEEKTQWQLSYGGQSFQGQLLTLPYSLEADSTN